jgi:Tol biopolymer transport system component
MPDPTNLPSESRASTSSLQKSAASERLDSWKEIAAYLRRSERTVRRWEATEGLPTHRHGHHRRASVYAFRSELDHWWSTRGAVAASRETEVPVPTSLRWVRVGVAVSLVALAGAATLFHRWTSNDNPDRQADTWRTVAVTSYPGAERFPSLSPDGSQVVFAWHRESSDNYDIYVQLVQGGTPLQLTSHLQHDWSPIWSPDGAWIAFLRWSPGINADLIVMPSLPGAERRLTTVAPLPGRGPISGGHLAWSPDGGWIATSDKEREDEPLGLFLVSTVTGEKRRLTQPDRGQRDTAPSFAPDGTRLAFVRILSFGISEIFQLQLSPTGHPAGEPTAVTGLQRLSTSPAWNASGTEIVFSSGELFTDRQLYRAPVSGAPASTQFQRISAETPDSTVIAMNRETTRVLYGREFFDPNVWMLTQDSRGGSPTTRVFAPSTWVDVNPQFSSDGERVAFESSRTGRFEIWTARRDGSNLLQVTSIGGAPTGSPSWAPDGRRIAFTSGAAGRSHVYIVGSEGGTATRLTDDGTNEALPTWSGDGRWIYFNSNRTGDSQVWKIEVPERGSASGDSAIQVTRNGGILAIESIDYRTLYFSKMGRGRISLWEMPLPEGEERQVVESLNDGVSFAPSKLGIFYVPRTNLATAGSIEFVDFARRKTTMIARIDKPLMVGMSAHPNGQSLLYSQVDREESDLIMLQRMQ